MYAQLYCSYKKLLPFLKNPRPFFIQLVEGQFQFLYPFLREKRTEHFNSLQNAS